MAEVSNNGIGLAGVAHGAKVLPVRVLGRCGGYTSDIADAIVWASGGSVPGVPANAEARRSDQHEPRRPVRVRRLMQGAIDTAVANGTTVVVSAGNSNMDAADFAPASCNNVITVGASRITGGKAFYSNFGTKVDSVRAGRRWWPGRLAGWLRVADAQRQRDRAGSGSARVRRHVGDVDGGPARRGDRRARAKHRADAAHARADGSDVEGDRAPLPRHDPGVQPMGVGILNAKAAVATVLPPCPGTDCESAAIAIANKVPRKNLAGAAGASQLSVRLDVPVGATGAELPDLRRHRRCRRCSCVTAQVPTDGAADVVSVHPGNNETARIAVARGGTVLRQGGRCAGLRRRDAGSAPQLTERVRPPASRRRRTWHAGGSSYPRVPPGVAFSDPAPGSR